MLLIDKITIGWKAFHRSKRKNKSTIIILVMMLIVFNMVYSLFTYIDENSSSSISQNKNFRYIQVNPMPSDQFSILDIKKMNEMHGIETAFFPSTVSVAFEYNNKGISSMLLGLDKHTASVMLGYEVVEDEFLYLNDTLKDEFFIINQNINISYNSKISDNKVIRKVLDHKFDGYYIQEENLFLPENVSIADQNTVHTILSELYGITVKEYLAMLSPNELMVITESVDDVNRVEKVLSEHGYLTSYSLKSSSELPLFAKVIGVLGIVIVAILLIISMINITSLINNTINDRYKHIGIYKTLGFTNKEVFEFLIYEMSFICVYSIIFGTLLSGVSIKILSGVVENNFPLFALLELSYGQVLTSILILIITVLVSSGFKIYKLSNVDPIYCLRRD